jgi:hypothetical protein
MGANQSSAIGLVLISLFSTAVSGQEAPPTELSIITYDAAHIGPKTLDQAERLAGTILLTARIRSKWQAGEAQQLANLGQDFTAYGPEHCQADRASVLRVQIFPRAPVGLPPNALGFSLPCARSGVQVTIYADRISYVIDRGGPTFGRVLGYAIAHELGHVILHSDAHAPAGLMKGTWSKVDWQRAAVSVIPFSPAEAEQIATLHEQSPEANIAQMASLKAR